MQPRWGNATGFVHLSFAPQSLRRWDFMKNMWKFVPKTYTVQMHFIEILEISLYWLMLSCLNLIPIYLRCHSICPYGELIKYLIMLHNYVYRWHMCLIRSVKKQNRHSLNWGMSPQKSGNTFSTFGHSWFIVVGFWHDDFFCCFILNIKLIGMLLHRMVAAFWLRSGHKSNSWGCMLSCLALSLWKLISKKVNFKSNVKKRCHRLINEQLVNGKCPICSHDPHRHTIILILTRVCTHSGNSS